MRIYTEICVDELDLNETLASLQDKVSTVEIVDIKPIVYPIEDLNTSNYSDLGVVNYLIIYKA